MGVRSCILPDYVHNGLANNLLHPTAASKGASSSQSEVLVPWRRLIFTSLVVTAFILARVSFAQTPSVLQSIGHGNDVELDIAALSHTSEEKIRSLPGNGHVVAEVPDIHLPKLIQLVLIKYDWGYLSFSWRTDTTTVAVRTVTYSFRTVPDNPLSALRKLNLPKINPETASNGRFKWTNVTAGHAKADLRIAANLKSAEIYFCPCYELLEDGVQIPVGHSSTMKRY